MDRNELRTVAAFALGMALVIVGACLMIAARSIAETPASGNAAPAYVLVSTSAPAPATVRLAGCGRYLAEDEAADVRLARFVRRADGSAAITYRCSAQRGPDSAVIVARITGCGAYVAEDEAAAVRLERFARRADGSTLAVYRCTAGAEAGR